MDGDVSGFTHLLEVVVIRGGLMGLRVAIVSLCHAQENTLCVHFLSVLQMPLFSA